MTVLAVVALFCAAIGAYELSLVCGVFMIYMWATEKDTDES